MSEHIYGKAVLDDLNPLTRNLRRAIPDVYSGFRELHHAAFAPGEALETKIKELIAVAIAVIEECDGCISSHSRAAVRAGATKAECADMLAVTFLMGGGPASVWAPRAYDAFCEFYDAEHPDEVTTEA